MADVNDSLVFDEARVSDAQALLEEIKNDLYDADCLLYDAVMKISYAPGIEHVEVEDSSIDMRMPERMMIQCREETKNVSDTLENQVRLVEQFTGAGTIAGESIVQARKTDTSTVELETDMDIGTGSSSATQLVYGPAPVPSTAVGTMPQVLYGPAPITSAPITAIDTMPQVLYGPAPITSAPITAIDTMPQVLYGPAPITEPKIYTSPPITTLYGPPPVPKSDPIYTSPPITTLYGPPPVPQPRVDDPVDTPPVGVDEHTVIIPKTEGSSSTTYSPEYANIPETGIGMKKSYSGYAAGAAAGALAGLAALGASKRKKKDEEEEENN